MPSLASTPYESLPGSLKAFYDYAVSYAGLNGGDPNSPIWFCALEQSDYPSIDASELNPVTQEFNYLSPQKALDWLRGCFVGVKGERGGCAFYRCQFSILGALIEKPESYWQMPNAKSFVQKYEFFGKNRLGYSLNVSPIAMLSRSKAEGAWKDSDVVINTECAGSISLKNWTGFPQYGWSEDPNVSFFAWCAKVRSPLFVELRRKYAPTVIYCGGFATAFNEFCILWSGKNRGELAFNKIEINAVECSYTWLDNGDGRRPTLLMIGPFFCNRNGLNSYKKYWSVAQSINAILAKKFGPDILKLKEFLPNK